MALAGGVRCERVRRAQETADNFLCVAATSPGSDNGTGPAAPGGNGTGPTRAYRAKYSNEWPNCENLRCYSAVADPRTPQQMREACDDMGANCTGFTLVHNATASGGCLKARRRASAAPALRWARGQPCVLSHAQGCVHVCTI